MQTPITYFFADDGAVPNNPALPMLVYKAALDLSGARDPETAIEKLFDAHDWGNGRWRNGIFAYAHYHSMIHEVLGIARGTAKVRFGGDKGEVLDLEPGDIAVLPAGTSGYRRHRIWWSLAAIRPPAPTTCAAATGRPTGTARSRRSPRCRCQRPIRSAARMDPW